ncbi:Pentatricopeptide repeat-containing protein -chloroplastic [Striga hermonthica]|uniref:Pentatricopeptide repeat-containing protein -chloroplastic n=1 Tax=Striga hermonthica TaxID=68872 RepID=A0A9N7MP19_STRHE|nr:Pentatricopeptide repeat-containing protein -chloroplastic [Striga hermonthica]
MLQIHAPQLLSHNQPHRVLAASRPPPPTSSTPRKHPSIQSLCGKGQIKEAIRQLKHEQNPTQQTYELLIQSCAHKNSIADAFSVHESLTENGKGQDPFLATKLIDMYSELNSIQDARQVFDEIPHKTIYVWNAIFRALSVAGHGKEVLGLYRKMNQIGMPNNDRFTYTYALKACVVCESEFSSLSLVKEIHAHILRHGYEPNVHIMTTLVDTYAKYGLVDEAHLVFSPMPAKNLVSWTAMITCFAKNGKPSEALNLFREMVLANDAADDGRGVLPNSVTMVSVLQACASICALEQGKLIHAYVLRRGLESILPVMNALITMYAKCGELESSKNIFDRMEKKDVVSWNSMISSYGIHGLGKDALSVFRDMVGSGVSPSVVTFVSLLGACSHAGLVDEGKDLFNSMVKEYGIRPVEEHYACMVDLLGRANLLDEAAQFIVDMRNEPGPKVWGALLGACRIHCNFVLAERACEKLFEMEPENAGNYVLLADIYAEAKMWEDVNRVKKLLEARGLEKVPGCSWIEVGKSVHALRSVDELNPQIELIHDLLVKLSREMIEKDTKAVLYDLDYEEKPQLVLGHSEKLAVAFGLINCDKGATIRITKNLRLCEDCHSFTKFVSRFEDREILVRDVNRVHRFRDGECSCGNYW